MSFKLAILISGIGLVLLIFIISSILSRFNRRSFAASFIISHLIFIIVLSVIYFSGEKVAQHQLFWLIPALFDLPISLIYPLFYLNMTCLILSFAILGTIQYAIIGWLIDLIVSKNKKDLLPSRKIVIPILVILGVFALLGYRHFQITHLSDYEKSQLELKKAKTEYDRFYALNDSAKTSFEAQEYGKAKKYADELLILARKYPNNWNYGNAIYDAHVVLGRLALVSGNVTSAQEHLFSAVKTPGSPQLNSFGPNMTLANDLLKKGQKEIVIEFLNQCKRFWHDHKQVDDWVREIQAGKIPDFGANLEY